VLRCLQHEESIAPVEREPGTRLILPALYGVALTEHRIRYPDTLSAANKALRVLNSRAVGDLNAEAALTGLSDKVRVFIDTSLKPPTDTDADSHEV
jgi:hypothetical protein